MTGTPLSYNEQSQETFNSVVSIAQEKLFARSQEGKAFAEVTTRAQDNIVQVKVGSIKVAEHDGNGAGAATSTKQKWILKPLPIEFAIDVEIIARKTLSASEFSYFKRTYFGDLNRGGFLGIATDSNDWTEDGRDKYFAAHLETYPESQRDEIVQFDRNIRRKLGAALQEQGMYPPERYMNTGQYREDIRDKYKIPLTTRSQEQSRMLRHHTGAHVFHSFPTAGVVVNAEQPTDFAVNSEGADQDALDAFFRTKETRNK